MTKYIDLLREHQQEPSKKKVKKSKKNKVGKLGAAQDNPYSSQKDNDKELIENMEALLEEQETQSIQETTDVEDDLGFAQEESSEVEQAEVQPADTPQPNTTTEYGFAMITWLQNMNQTLLRMFTSVQNNEPINLSILDEQLSTLFDQVQTSTDVLNTLELEISAQLKNNDNTHPHADLAQKSIMMMLYSTKVGTQLNLQLHELLPYVIAAMLQHLGMAMVPSNIRQKTKKLTRDESKQIKQAPQMALDYLQAHNITHEQLIPAISQNSERYDGSGPEGLEGHDIAWVARLTSLLSTFEAMTHFRAYRQRLLPRDAIREIIKEHKKEFDPSILKALIESISLYPVGTIVQINTGEIGHVTQVHTQLPLRPCVLITMDRQASPIDERKIDLAKQSNLIITESFFEKDLAEIRAN